MRSNKRGLFRDNQKSLERPFLFAIGAAHGCNAGVKLMLWQCRCSGFTRGEISVSKNDVSH